MPITYDGGSGLFDDLGKLIKTLNSYQSIAATTLAGDLTALITQFGTRWDFATGITRDYQNFQRDVVNWRNRLRDYITARLLDYDTVQTHLRRNTTDLRELLLALWEQMDTDAESVDASAVSVGSPSYDADNHGSGKVFGSAVLDGYNEPVSGGYTHPLFNGLPSELAGSETVTLECVADSDADGLTEGSEQFQITGEPIWGTLDYRANGSGPGPTIACANAGGYLVNPDFEDFTTNAPDSWTLVAGTAGAHFHEETTAANVYRGTSSLKVTGDGTVTPTLKQAISPSLFNGKRRYFFGIAVKADASITVGDLTVQFTGTGYTAGSSEKIEIAAASLPTSWTLYGAFVNTPAVIPDGWALQISFAALDNTKRVWLDSIGLDAATYHGGVAWAASAGSSRWLRGDRVLVALTNDGAGVFQEFFRKAYQIQLPSKSDGSETIADTLAT